MKNKGRKIPYLALLTAFAIILSYVEHMMPPIFVGVPGIKMGLANIVVLYLLYSFGFKWAIGISLTRVIIVSLLFGNIMTFSYSLVGAVLSILAMYLLKRLNLFSYVGVSVVGGVAHNIGQVLVAMFLLERAEIGYYMIVLAFSGVIAGVFVGLVGAYLLKRTDKVLKKLASTDKI